MPENRIASKIPIIASVLAAFRAGGFLKAGMALEMASTPVNAEHPEEKALSSKNSVMPATGVPSGV